VINQFKLTIIIIIIMMLLVVMLRRIVIVIVIVVIVVVVVSIAVIIAVVVIVIAIIVIVITTHNTNAVNRNRIKLKLIIADKRYFFSNELSVPTHRVLLEKWQVTVLIHFITKRYLCMTRCMSSISLLI